MISITEKIKNYIRYDCGMDDVGIAPASALSDEAPEHRPEHILPEAKSIIVFTKRIPAGVIQTAFRNLEDKNADALSIYSAYGRDIMPTMNLFFMQFNIAQYIERNFGYTAVPLPSGPMQNVQPTNQPMPSFVGAKRIAYLVHSERAAAAAGLGEIGWNNQLVTAKNGPRQAIGLVLTNMELDYDKPYDGERLCDPEKCGICSRLCPISAIPAYDGESETWTAAGKSYKVAKINANACAVASMAFRSEFSDKDKVPDQIMNNAPTDEELSAAFKTKPLSNTTIDHYPKHHCNKCILYCPIGGWQKKFGDTGLSKFRGEEL